MSLPVFVVRFDAVSYCGECPYYDPCSQDERPRPDWCDAPGDSRAFDEPYKPNIRPDWCPLNAGMRAADLTDVPHDVLADLVVAIDRHLSRADAE